jgi:FAD dependent oxidoreductase TIGR03364
MAKILIIGGGVIGTMHAWQALERGHQVVQVERDLSPRSASVRNFGLVWVSGRASGAEFDEAIRARELWGKLAQDNKALQFRANGSLTIARTEAELAVMQESSKKADAESRGWRLLDAQETRVLNPALRGKFLGSLWCPLDAAVEPSAVLGEVRGYLAANPNYEVNFGVEIVDLSETESAVTAISRTGEKYSADLVILCPGADHSTLFGDNFKAAPLRRVRLQMMSTAPLDEDLTTSIADGDSLRYYPGYDVPALKNLPPQHPIAAEHAMQLLLVQRTDGTLTIGDTHEYEEPFEFKLREDVYQYLADVASDILGRRIPEIVNRWDGVYSQRTDGAICDRQQISPRIISVTGPGGRGNSLSPAIAETTFKTLID